jgi:hypothetical protein
MERRALAAARGTVGGATADGALAAATTAAAATLELDALGGVPGAVAAVVVVLFGGAGPRARVGGAGPLVAVGQLVDVAVEDAAAVEALAVFFAGAAFAVVVVGLVGTARRAAVIVPVVAIAVVTVVTVTVTFAVPSLAVRSPLAIAVSVTLPVAVTMVTVAVVAAVTLSIAVTITVMVAVAIPVSFARVAHRGRAASGRPAVREQDVGCAGLAVVTFALGHGMAALSLIGILLNRAAAPHRTGTAAMRSLTSVTIAVWAVTAATLLLGLVFLLLKPADVLLEGAPPGLVGAYSLEGGNVG